MQDVTPVCLHGVKKKIGFLLVGQGDGEAKRLS